MNALAPPDPALTTVALRTRLISALLGISESRLRYWHRSALQSATSEPGARGVPRLYSWLDYQRLCAVVTLDEMGFSVVTIRKAMRFMDEHIPDWWTASLSRHDSPQRPEVAHITPGRNPILVTQFGQMVLDPEGLELARAAMASVQTLRERGPLFSLRQFDDAVDMKPGVCVGLPTLVGTRLETAFVRALVIDYGSEKAVAALYDLQPWVIKKAVAFEKRVAA